MKNNCVIKILLLFWISIFPSAIMAEQITNVTLDRSWGLLLGDEIMLQVDMSAIDEGIDLDSLPQFGKRYGIWLYLKNIDVLPQQLVFNYQVVNVPTENTLIATPEFNIKQKNGQWIVIPPTSLTIGPLLPSNDEAGIVNIDAQPDLSPTLIATTKIKQQLQLYTLIFVLSAVVLTLWHFGWKPKNRQPFAQALHDLARLKWQRSVAPDQASRILHTAFNHTAGTIVIYGEIDELVQQQTWLAPLKNDIEAFYQRSAQHFFARKAEQEPDVDMVKKLAKACRAKEKLA